MREEKKTPIGIESCQRELLSEKKATLPLVVILSALLILVAIVFLTVDTGNRLGNVLCLLFAVFFCVVSLCTLIPFLSELVRIRRGDLVLTEDVLERIAVETVRRYTLRGVTYHEQKAFYFAEHGRYVVGKVDGNAFDYSDAGDGFYLLLFRGDIKPRRIYSKKIYGRCE